MANAFEDKHLPRYREEGYAYLATIPEVKRFLDTEIFDTIKLIREQLLGEASMVILDFDVVAPKLMPHPRARLLEKGLVKRNNLLNSAYISDGVRQTVRFFGSCLQIHLNIRGKAATPDKGVTQDQGA